MSDDKTKTDQGADGAKPEPEVKDGKITVDADVFNGYKNDMHQYKKERNELREQVAAMEKKINEIDAKDKKAKEDHMKEQQQFKELADLKEKENAELKQQIVRQRIDTAIKTKALQMGINDPNDVKLGDMSKVVINDAGDVDGVDQYLEGLKTAKPYLFQAPGGAPKVDTSKAGGIPENLTRKDLVNNAALAVKVKKEKPDLYNRLMA